MTGFWRWLRQSPLGNLGRSVAPNWMVNSFYHLPRAVLANCYYRFPARQLTVIGVTGTDGKTTTVNLIYHLLSSTKADPAMVSTIKAVIGNQEYETGLHVTNPDPIRLQQFLTKAVKTGAKTIVLEVTSHGLDQNRVWGIPFAVGVYTNIAADHLSYHRSWESYLAAKAKLAFQARTVVLNAADQGSRLIGQKLAKRRPKTRLVWYGVEKEAELSASRLVTTNSGTTFDLDHQEQTIKVRLPLPGRYNVANALAALATVTSLGITLKQAVKALASAPPVPGRLERIDQGQPFKVIVDFAHTPQALEAVLTLLRQGSSGRLTVVFGCAGERDPGRRRMGEVAARLADLTVITAEDPRLEGVKAISQEIAAWAKKGGGVQLAPDELLNWAKKKRRQGSFFTLVPDRTEATRLAFKTATAGDTVLITGKGHERSMCFGQTEIPWSDQETVKKVLRELGY